MEIDMKKVSMAFVLLAFIALISGCSKKNSEKISMNISMKITADYNEELIVPNPETTENNVSIVMRYFPDFDKYEAYDEMDKCYQSCAADLSFLGFKNKMMISAYKIGAITNRTSQYTHVELDIPDDYLYNEKLPILKNRDIYGNCLILAAKDSVNEDDDNYIIVLDYEKHKNYVMKTAIWNPEDDHMPALQLCDFTGDGLDDIVISNSLNEEVVNMQVFKFEEEALKSIYIMLDGEENTEDKIFGYLDDNYKAVIEYKPINLKREKSLLKLGYTKKQLQSSNLLRNDKYPYSHVYDMDGKVKKDLGDRDIKAGLAQDMKICKINDFDNVIRYSQYVSYAKYNSVCELYVYLKYDTEKDLMDIYNIDVRWNKSNITKE